MGDLIERIVMQTARRRAVVRTRPVCGERGRSGRVLLLDLESRSVRTLASGLRYAFGVCAAGSDLFVSESWRHRVIALGADGSQRTVLEHLPVYPSRLSTASNGGYWLTAFIARTQLVEFVLRENAYRRRMMNEIDPEYWIAPKLKSGQSFLEPMQGAHIKTMGVVMRGAESRASRFLDVIEDHLGVNGPYFLGNEVSAVDLYLVMLARWARPMTKPPRARPHIARLLDLVASRPAVQRAYEAEGISAPIC